MKQINNIQLNICLRNTISTPLQVSGYTESDTKSVLFDGVASISFEPSIIIYHAGVNFAVESDLDIEAPDSEAITYTLSEGTTAADCTGGPKGRIFSDTEELLYIGRDATNKRKSWMPFELDFSSSTNGIHVVSATIKVAAWDTQLLIDNQPCKVKVACDRTINSTDPTNWSTLGGKSITNENYWAGRLTEDWIEGEVYDFDITDSVKEMLGGENAIIWDNTDLLSVIFNDFGSYPGSYRTLVSYEGSGGTENYDPPTLEIIYADNYYTDKILNTWIFNKVSDQINFESEQIFVGEPSRQSNVINRGLMKIDLSSIPDTATVTSAKLYLYLEREQSTNARTMYVYPFLKAWDLYGVSWDRPYGTSNWTAVGAFDTADCSHTEIGSIAFSASEARNVYKEISLDDDSLVAVQSWVTTPATNYGFMLKMNGTSTEANDAYIFASTQSEYEARKPYFEIEYTDGGTPYTKTVYWDRIE